MKNPKNSNKRGPQMRQRVTQKHTMRNVVIASSILGCMAVAFVVVNLSNQETSYANNSAGQSSVSYRSVDTHLSERMLLDASKYHPEVLLDYKGKEGTQTIAIESRAVDAIVKKKDQISTQ
ncbi:MAG: hypothetical protein IPK10_08315 [Bacteroidetes bacterium]|nr:hypothetical protein [Bacteroidota bacterium]